jgi:hypothetical protein
MVRANISSRIGVTIKGFGEMGLWTAKEFYICLTVRLSTKGSGNKMNRMVGG